MKNNERFGNLTPRMDRFREAVLDKKPYICAERAILATESYKENQHQPSVMKRALMLKNILEKMTIYIEDETLIVGNQAKSNKDAPIFPEYTLEFVMTIWIMRNLHFLHALLHFPEFYITLFFGTMTLVEIGIIFIRYKRYNKE